MKKTFLFSLVVLMHLAICAQPVSQDEAMQRAARFMAGKIHRTSIPRMRKVMQQLPADITTARQNAYYYVFNVDEAAQGGFVVVSGDDRAPSILGYSASGTFDAEQIPANLKAWLDGYAEQLRYIEEHQLPAQHATTAAPTTVIEPLLTTTWNQTAPYSDKCPTDPSTKKASLTGCVATAMAQVLNYHRHPSQTLTTIPSYRVPYDTKYNYLTGQTEYVYYTVPAIEPTTIDWDHMRNDYTKTNYSQNYTSEEADAVATLMQLCGTAVQMQYSSEGSGAYTAYYPYALTTYFDYDPSLFLANRSDYSAAQWESMIYEELLAHRPVLYGGASMGGSHAFVVDGYDGQGMFHLNWGWSGQADSYFLLSILNPYTTEMAGASSTNDGFSFQQDALIGLKPNAGGQPSVLRVSTADLSLSNTSTVQRRGSDGMFRLSLQAQLYSYDPIERTFDVGLGVFNQEGTMLEWKGYGTTGLMSYGDDDYTAQNFQNFTFGKDLPDGTYKVKVISKNSDAQGALLPNLYSTNLYVEVTISGSQATLRMPVVSLSGGMEPTGSLSPNGSVPLRAIVTNDGTDFNDDVYLIESGQAVAGFHLDVETGQTAMITLECLPTRSGSKTYQLAYISSYQYNSRLQTYVPVYKTICSATFYASNGAQAASENLLTATATIDGLTNGHLTTGKACGTITVSNTGSRIYYDNVQCQLLKKSTTGTYDLMTALPAQHLFLQRAATQTIGFDFGTLEANQDYSLCLCYAAADGDEALQRQSVLTTFTVGEPEPVDTVYDLRPVIAIANADQSMTVRRNETHGRVTVSNESAFDYDGTATLTLYQVANDDSYSRSDAQDYRLTVGANATATVDFSFDNLPGLGRYALAFSYMKRPGEQPVEHSPYTHFTVEESKDTLHIAYVLADTIANNHEHFTLKGDELSGMVRITNVGTNDYVGDVVTDLRLLADGVPVDLGRKEIFTANLKVGKSTVMEIWYDGLSSQNTYVLTVDYVNEGRMTTMDNNTDYLLFTVVLADDSPTGIDRLAASLGSNTMVTVTDLAGRTVACVRASEIKTTLSRLPKAVYVIAGRKMRN